MTKFTEQQINTIYLRCSQISMENLLQYCLDPESGITLEGLRAVHYPKIDQLEQRYSAQAEEIIWAKSQSSVEALTQFIDKCKRGIFSNTHLHEAMDLRKTLAAAMEEEDWEKVRNSKDTNRLMEYIKRCIEGTYSEIHLVEAKNLVEFLDWETVKDSRDTNLINGYIQKCNTGFYLTNHLKEAAALLEQMANGTIVEEWNNLAILGNTDPKKLALLNAFIQKYKDNVTQTGKDYMEKADELMKVMADAEAARKDWIDAKQANTILGYVNFLASHPYCEYREEAEVLIRNMKGNLLTDMKRYPFRYGRELMYSYISTNALTQEELVDTSHTLTDRAYNHIKTYPTLQHEQRKLPTAKLEQPHSTEGNTDVYFFGVPGSGKSCVLAGLMAQTGNSGFSFDPRGQGGGGNYAMELCNYARKSMLPPKTDDYYIQVIDAEINDKENNRLHKLSLIEMAGERTAAFAAIENPTNLEDLGTGAAGLLSNDNYKVIFFVIDPTNEKIISLNTGDDYWITQSNVLDCISSLLLKNKALMKKITGIHIILTKSDTLGDYVDRNTIQELLHSQGYNVVLERLNKICETYDINKQTNFQVGLYPFCIGKFMPGDVYTFDDTDSLKILRVIKNNTVPTSQKKGFLDNLSDWFNS